MSQKTQSKRAILRDRVVDLVVEFVNQEGDISQNDLEYVLGRPFEKSVTFHLTQIPTIFSHCRDANLTKSNPAKSQSKRNILRDRIVALVVEFVNQEGGMSRREWRAIFYEGSVANSLCKIPVMFSPAS